jgi:hypothetical protein
MDDRIGCVAVYPENQNHVCLSGANWWAIHYHHGEKDKDGNWVMNQETIDNARLIAAAPDLLSACETALAQMGKLEHIYRSDQYNAVLDQLRAAIARAKGSTP